MRKRNPLEPHPDITRARDLVCSTSWLKICQRLVKTNDELERLKTGGLPIEESFNEGVELAARICDRRTTAGGAGHVLMEVARDIRSLKRDPARGCTGAGVPAQAPAQAPTHAPARASAPTGREMAANGIVETPAELAEALRNAEPGDTIKVAQDLGSTRNRFEHWISASPYERSIRRYSSDPTVAAWPDQYADYSVQIAWEAVQEFSK